MEVSVEGAREDVRVTRESRLRRQSGMAVDWGIWQDCKLVSDGSGRHRLEPEGESQTEG